jgi:hypothetical protein
VTALSGFHLKAYFFLLFIIDIRYLLSISLTNMESLNYYTTHALEARGYPKAEKVAGDKVHGTIAALSVTLVIPLGALSWRLLSQRVSPKTLLWIHMGSQALGLAMLVITFGTGIWTAITHDEV